MSGSRAGHRRRRAALVVVLLAGLFAMHGLTANHAVAMLPGKSMTQHQPSATTASSTTSTRAVSEQPTAPDNGMAGACLAVLAGSLLLALILAGHTHRSTAGSRTGPAAANLLRAARGSPPTHLTPSLSQLCVLRT